MKKVENWIVLIIGILLILPLIGVSQLGTISSGIIGWLIALAVLMIGLLRVRTK